MNIISFAAPEAGNWLVKIIGGIIEATSSVAVGVILFTLILKLITLPFDVISRVSMRKNSLKMEEMREDLEKLQKQYSNDKALYNQKMMALYKKNGYSMMSSCLPSIVTIVIFIVAISAFSNYSNYRNQQSFYDMSIEYNSAIYEGFENDGNYIYYKNDKLEFKKEALLEAVSTDSEARLESNGKVILVKKVDANSFSVHTENGYMEYLIGIDADGNPGSGNYIVLEDALLSNTELVNAAGKTYAEVKKENIDAVASDFIKSIAQERSAKKFRSELNSFLWVKNIWVADSPMEHPVLDYGSFSSTISTNKGCGCNSVVESPVDEAAYNDLVAGLSEEKEQANGYFVLIALIAVLTFLTQFITAKSQKAQMELQTVDGQGAQTQKMMTWMMPVMMVVFSFFYSASFSIYIVLSTSVSLVTTVLINFILEKKYGGASTKSGEVIRGRVYTPKPEEIEQNTKKKTNKNSEEIPDKDFFSKKKDGEVKHIRGRLK